MRMFNNKTNQKSDFFKREHRFNSRRYDIKKTRNKSIKSIKIEENSYLIQNIVFLSKLRD
jgi:hypothetical protein